MSLHNFPSTIPPSIPPSLSVFLKSTCGNHYIPHFCSNIPRNFKLGCKSVLCLFHTEPLQVFAWKKESWRTSEKRLTTNQTSLKPQCLSPGCRNVSCSDWYKTHTQGLLSSSFRKQYCLLTDVIKTMRSFQYLQEEQPYPLLNSVLLMTRCWEVCCKINGHPKTRVINVLSDWVTHPPRMYWQEFLKVPFKIMWSKKLDVSKT